MAAFLALQARRPRNFRARPDLLRDLTDSEVVARYRLSKDSTRQLVDVVAPSITRPTGRNSSLSPTTQVLIALRILAKGDFYSEVGDLHGVDKSTVSRCFWPVIAAINERLDNIRFPMDAAAIRAMKMDFFHRGGIPNVIGAIDGTLVPILAPREEAVAFICRKGFHSLNVMAVAAPDLRFIDCVARWPGSQHDSAVFNASGLKEHLEANEVGHLVGDSGYALKRYLLTPKAVAHTPAEARYNQAHSRTRVVVERAFGLLKSRFRCLHKSGGCMLFAPGKASQVVEACMRLHNLCLENRDPEPADIVDDNLAINDPLPDPDNNVYRQRIIQLFA